ncbi:UbiA-like protein EboC [Fulvivirga ligni]|uniref:UbiA-like protein EboC n=1 Tax=Fulvivirga ligni TaxID=2904246 RepID=UPI001F3871CD|nr:UbiA-like protein EboC [Fulvivirga ligni]UII20222.1 UbiA-like protein EboC [Fulvivirga ligni]
MNRLVAHLRLMRPANIITALADILAGVAISGVAVEIISGDEVFSDQLLKPILYLMLSTIGLYGGGVIFNDVFDAELDRVERPERPIPSGKASVLSASILGAIFLLIGILAAFYVNVFSGSLAIAIAVLALLYDAWGKHQLIFGPINMGLCRGVNLLLGISLVPEMVTELWYVSLIPVVYIAAITMISRGEVHGANRKALKGGAVMYAFILVAVLLLALKFGQVWWYAVPFIILFAYLIFPPLFKALNNQEPKWVGKAVKAGVLSLIVLNAAMAAAFAGWQWALLVLVLLPISILLAKAFAVT